MSTCFKHPSRPSWIDVMLTNHPRSFQNSLAIDTGLSDFHRITVTVMKAYSPKLRPKLVNYIEIVRNSQMKHFEMNSSLIYIILLLIMMIL